MRRRQKIRRGLTLLELIIASALLTVVVAGVGVVLRGMHVAWQAHDGDVKRIQAAHATLRHIVRQCRQGTAVTALTASGNTAGSLSLTLSDGSTAVWARNAATNEVNFGIGAASDLLAEHITELTFTGYEADGVTPTTTPADVRSVKCRVRVDLPRDTNGARYVSSRVWLRSW
jgi:prepilin-type N-terminal cleavage/methylation domain-containing protein